MQNFAEMMMGADVSLDGRGDFLDLRILLRYLTGLRDEASGDNVDNSRIRALLGLELTK